MSQERKKAKQQRLQRMRSKLGQQKHIKLGVGEAAIPETIPKVKVA